MLVDANSPSLASTLVDANAPIKKLKKKIKIKRTISVHFQWTLMVFSKNKKYKKKKNIKKSKKSKNGIYIKNKKETIKNIYKKKKKKFDRLI
jgi:hypothetical protein